MNSIIFSLPIKSFAFFKVVLGAIFLLVAIMFQNVLHPIFMIIPLMVGKAHTIGAWFAMWAAKKLNWTYVSFVTFYVFLFMYLGLFYWELNTLIIITYILFAFHYLFDEYDLQEEMRSWGNMAVPAAIFIQLCIYTLAGYEILKVDFSIYIFITLMAIIIETLFLKEITWFYINLKILSIFVLYCICFGIGHIFLFSTILLAHYMFWFFYPVYKLHKFKREERDGLIMILLILILTSVYVVWVNNDISQKVSDPYNFPLRYFAIFTIVHVLATAPFAYLIGLPRSKKH